MNSVTRLQRRLARIGQLVSGIVDCYHESRNDLDRQEWDLLDTNLRTLFRNGTAIARLRRAVLRALRQARKEVPAR